MFRRRTPQEETVRQLKILNAQMNPAGALIKVALFITASIAAISLLMRLLMAFK